MTKCTAFLCVALAVVAASAILGALVARGPEPGVPFSEIAH